MPGTRPGITNLTVVFWDDAALRGCRRALLLRRARHPETLIALGGDVVADLAIDADAADIRHEDARLARDVGAHVPGIGLRIERAMRDFVDMGHPFVLGLA